MISNASTPPPPRQTLGKCILPNRTLIVAAEPCCDWVYGKYINLKTGKEVKPPKGEVAPGSVESAASPAQLLDRIDRRMAELRELTHRQVGIG